MSSWYNAGTDNDIIVTSRIRLARNIEGIPLPSRMSDDMRATLNSSVKAAIIDSITPFSKALKFYDMNDVPECEAYAMVERHVISPEFAENKRNKAIIISEDESVCVMIGEEDHIRIQVVYNGLSLEKAYDTAERIDTLLCDKLHFAFNPQLGFLTECPTNLGTGLRASVMLHLPLLEASDEISTIADSVAKIGFTVRGMYGEGSEAKASLYQLSNQITLGISERDAIKNLEAITGQIIDKEQLCREECNKIRLEDRIYRSYGILQNARLINTAEMMKYISLIKLGASMGILEIDKTLPVRILIEGQPNMLMRRYGMLDSEERDIKRAEMIRELL